MKKQKFLFPGDNIPIKNIIMNIIFNFCQQSRLNFTRWLLFKGKHFWIFNFFNLLVSDKKSNGVLTTPDGVLAANFSTKTFGGTEATLASEIWINYNHAC